MHVYVQRVTCTVRGETIRLLYLIESTIIARRLFTYHSTHPRCFTARMRRSRRIHTQRKHSRANVFKNVTCDNTRQQDKVIKRTAYHERTARVAGSTAIMAAASSRAVSAARSSPPSLGNSRRRRPAGRPLLRHVTYATSTATALFVS
jgi:hypothetical protein